MFKRIAMCILFLLSTPARAGIPINETVECPIGGEKFDVVSTAACSYVSRNRTMAFQAFSTCDFVTRLPQCPGNKLPLYKEFSPSDLELITAFMETDAYAKLRERSPYFLAYAIEGILGNTTEPVSTFSLLLAGIWFDGERTHGDAEYLAALLSESSREIANAGEEERPYVQAITAYLAFWSGDAERARKEISAIELDDIKDKYLAAYIQKIEVCIDSGVTESCRPDSVINFDEMFDDE